MTTVDDLMALADVYAITRARSIAGLGGATYANVRGARAELEEALWAALQPAQAPVAHMWQHPETGSTGFVEHAPLNELAHWEHMNRPRKIVAALYPAPVTQEPTSETP
jgi:hypothetical protein